MERPRSSPAPSVALRITHVQPRHQQKAADQTEMLEKLVFDHEAAGRLEFPEPVCENVAMSVNPASHNAPSHLKTPIRIRADPHRSVMMVATAIAGAERQRWTRISAIPRVPYYAATGANASWIFEVRCGALCTMV
jgi:hypothetical protein